MKRAAKCIGDATARSSSAAKMPPANKGGYTFVYSSYKTQALGWIGPYPTMEDLIADAEVVAENAQMDLDSFSGIVIGPNHERYRLVRSSTYRAELM